MANFKYKDLDGQWKSIINIKGDKGDRGPAGPRGPEGPAGTSGINYSLEENLTGGTWIDGKPVYRKVVEHSFTATSTGTVSSSKDISNIPIESIINLYYTTKHGPSSIMNNTFYLATNNSSFIFYRPSSKTLEFRVGNGAVDGIPYDFTIVLEYTKSTN